MLHLFTVFQVNQIHQRKQIVHSSRDELFMEIAIKEAEKALREKEVPIGAVLVKNEKIIARGHNQCIMMHDPTAHAEINTLRRAAEKTGNYRLTETVLYVTIEPCIMCMGALLNARIKKLIYGAPDIKAGAAGSVYDFSDDKRLNHKFKVESGILASSCSQLIQGFFRQKRKCF